MRAVYTEYNFVTVQEPADKQVCFGNLQSGWIALLDGQISILWISFRRTNCVFYCKDYPWKVFWTTGLNRSELRSIEFQGKENS